MTITQTHKNNVKTQREDSTYTTYFEVLKTYISLEINCIFLLRIKIFVYFGILNLFLRIKLISTLLSLASLPTKKNVNTQMVELLDRYFCGWWIRIWIKILICIKNWVGSIFLCFCLLKPKKTTKTAFDRSVNSYQPLLPHEMRWTANFHVISCGERI